MSFRMLSQEAWACTALSKDKDTLLSSSPYSILGCWLVFGCCSASTALLAKVQNWIEHLHWLVVLSSLLGPWPLHDAVITAFAASYAIFVHLGHDVHID
jgi:hypothetical protein